MTRPVTFRSRGHGSNRRSYPIFPRSNTGHTVSPTGSDPWSERRAGIVMQQSKTQGNEARDKCLRYYRGLDGSIHVQANTQDRQFGLRFKTVSNMKDAFKRSTHFKEVDRSMALEEKYDINYGINKAVTTKRREDLSLQQTDGSYDLSGRATWELRNMKNALESFRLLNTKDDEERLETVKRELNRRKHGGSTIKIDSHTVHNPKVAVTIRDLNDRNDLTLVTDSQDTQEIKMMVPHSQDYDSFLVKVDDGGYKEVYGFEGSVPDLHKRVERIV